MLWIFLFMNTMFLMGKVVCSLSFLFTRNIFRMENIDISLYISFNFQRSGVQENPSCGEDSECMETKKIYQENPFAIEQTSGCPSKVLSVCGSRGKQSLTEVNKIHDLFIIENATMHVICKVNFGR